MRRVRFVPSAPGPLEERVALSHGGLPGPALTVHPLVQSQTLSLNGSAGGRQSTHGPIHELSAEGDISPLNGATLPGHLTIPVPVGQTGIDRGLVRISSSHGSISVRLAGEVTVYSAAFPFATGDLTYTAISGAGACKGATGTGRVLSGNGPVFQPGKPMLVFGNTAPPP